MLYKAFDEAHKCSGLVAQWITRLTTDQKIAGSNPAKVVFHLFFLSHFLCRTI